MKKRGLEQIIRFQDFLRGQHFGCADGNDGFVEHVVAMRALPVIAAKMDGGVLTVIVELEGLEARGQVDGDAGMFARKSGRRGASQRVPKVGRMARLSVPPSGLAFSASEAEAIDFKAARISLA